MDKLQVHRDTYMYMYYVYVICIEAKKFENENTATKHIVFLSELCDYWTTTNWHDRLEY